MPVIPVLITDDSDKTIRGTHVFDRDGGGILVLPSGEEFPATPVEGEWFLRTDTMVPYRYNGAGWDAQSAEVVPHAIGGGQHQSSTLAQLNALITDADMDDASSARPPQSHDINSHSGQLLHSALGTIGADDHHPHANKVELDKITDGDHDVRSDNPHGVTASQAGAIAAPSSTDNAVARYDGAAGQVQNSVWFIDDNGALYRSHLVQFRTNGSGDGQLVLRDAADAQELNITRKDGEAIFTLIGDDAKQVFEFRSKVCRHELGGLTAAEMLRVENGSAELLCEIRADKVTEFGGDMDVQGNVRVGKHFASSYKLSVQRDTPLNDFTYIEILNSAGAGKGAFFGIETYSGRDDFSLYNWQGGDIVFWTHTSQSQGLERVTIKNTGVVRIHGLGSGVVQADAQGNLSSSQLDHSDLASGGTTSHADIDTHVGSTSNPHGVTAAQAGAISTTEKGVANGVATLDAGAKIPAAQIPSVALPEVHVVADATARLALTVQEGDEAIQLDDGSHWIYDGTTWHQRTAGSGDVVGPSSSSDHAIARFDGTTGKLLQNSPGAWVNDAGDISATSFQSNTYVETESLEVHDTALFEDEATFDGNIIANALVDGRDVAADGAAQDAHLASTSNPHQTGVFDLSDINWLGGGGVGDILVRSFGEWAAFARGGSGQILMVDTNQDLDLVWTTPNWGEDNVGQNYGLSGVGPYYGKSGVTLRFRNIDSEDGIAVTSDAANRTIDVGLDVDGLTEEPAIARGDFLPFYDVTAGAHRKVEISDVVSLGAAMSIAISRSTTAGGELFTSTTPVDINFSVGEESDTAVLEFDEVNKELLVKKDGLLEINGALGILQTAVANRGTTSAVIALSVGGGSYNDQPGSGGSCYTRHYSYGERGSIPLQWIGAVSAGDKFKVRGWRQMGTVTTSVESKRGSLNVKWTEA